MPSPRRDRGGKQRRRRKSHRCVLLEVSAPWGVIALTLPAGIGIRLLGERLCERDVTIGILRAMSLWLVVRALLSVYATHATALLFGVV